MKDPRYLLELLLRGVTVSAETMKIVNVLPKLDIQALDAVDALGFGQLKTWQPRGLYITST